jgi:2,3-dihydroxybenzoate decarboxylase
MLIAIEEAFSVPAWDARQARAMRDVRDSLPTPELRAEFARRHAFFRDELVPRLHDIDGRRIAEMDEHGIDVQVLSLTTPGIQAVADAAEACRDAREANDYLADAIRKAPGRFRGFAALPLQDPAAAVAELRRAVGDLGFVGALVNDHTLGRYLDEPQFEPLWLALEDLDVPLYLHPGAPPVDRWHVLNGHPELVGPSWSWGAEVSGHMLRILFAGVLDRHPKARVILGHMGEGLPFLVSRLDARYRQNPARRLRRVPSAYFGRNILITTSGVCSHAALTGALLALGSEAIMFAADYPFESTEEAVRFIRTAPLSPAESDGITHRNAQRLLRI